MPTFVFVKIIVLFLRPLRGMRRSRRLCRENFRRALKIREKALGVDHPDTQSSRSVVEDKNGASTEA